MNNLYISLIESPAISSKNTIATSGCENANSDWWKNSKLKTMI